MNSIEILAIIATVFACAFLTGALRAHRKHRTLAHERRCINFAGCECRASLVTAVCREGGDVLMCWTQGHTRRTNCSAQDEETLRADWKRWRDGE